MELSYSHENLTDDNVAGKLEDVKQKIGHACCKLDFSFNRLTVKGLKILAEYTRNNSNVQSICVAFNYFSFSEFYRTLADMQLTKLIAGERIYMYSTLREQQIERELTLRLEAERLSQSEALEAERKARNGAYEAESAAWKFEMKAERKVRNESSHKVDTQLSSLTKSVAGVTGWLKNQTKAFEQLMTNVAKQYIQSSPEFRGCDMMEVPREYLQLNTRQPNKMENLPCDGFDWDGALFFIDHNKKLVLYLIEAKTNIVLKAIKVDVPERIKKTETFMRLCFDNTLPGKDASFVLQAFCNAWSICGQPDEIRGVVGAHNFSEAMLLEARNNKFTCIYPDGDAYIADRPWIDGQDRRMTLDFHGDDDKDEEEGAQG